MRVCATLLIAILSFSGLALAAAGSSDTAAGHGEEHDPHAEFKHSAMVRKLADKVGMSVESFYWLSVGLNFAVLAWFLFRLTKKGLPNFFPPFRSVFKDRTSAIQKGLEEARRSSEEARRRLSEIEGRLARIDSEIAGLEANAEMQGREEEARLEAAVEEERQKIVRAAEQEIARVSNNARRELKVFTTELAISLAEKKMNIDADTDAEIVREFVEQLPSDGSPRRKG
jgi:F-type H+-transporting ATPase subunit b